MAMLCTQGSRALDPFFLAAVDGAGQPACSCKGGEADRAVRPAHDPARTDS